MPRHLKFLTIAVRSGRINEATRSLILKEQSRRRLLGEHHVRVGELLVQNRILDQAAVDEILSKQRPSGRRDFVSQQTETPLQALTFGWQVSVALLSLLAVGIVTIRNRERVELTIVVIGFLTYLLAIGAQLWAGRSFPHALQRAALPLIALIALSLVTFAVVSILTIKHEHSQGSAAQMDRDEMARVHTIELAFAAMSAAVCILLIYSIWKFHALRFAESRFGATKDILIRVESILRDNDVPIDERKREAIQTVLKGLRNTLKLSSSDRILRMMSTFVPSFNQTRVLYFIPEPSTGRFQIYEASYPEEVSEKVLEAFKWIKVHHQPVFLDEKEFEKQKEIAKSISPRDWRKVYLNMQNRDQYISVCGWIHDKQETLIASKASTCLALDTSYLREMAETGFDSKVLQWLEVGSFVGCRIVDSVGKPAGVLLAMKNMDKGFPPEDIEVVIAVSQILGRILQTA